MQNIQKVIASGTYDLKRPECVQAFIPQADQYFTLPSKVTKKMAISTGVKALRVFGGNATDSLVYQLIANLTEPGTWYSNTRASVNVQPQADMAWEAGISSRHFRGIEKRLERLGLLSRTTALNGYRGRREHQRFGAPVSCGLSLELTIANYKAFMLVIADADHQEELRRDRVLYVRTAKHRVSRLIEGIADTDSPQGSECVRRDEKDVTQRHPTKHGCRHFG